MYTPKHFALQDLDLIHELVERYNFASLISIRDQKPLITHLPFLFDRAKGPHGTLLAHMARANPQWKGFQQNAAATVLFQGPHAYVSPRWYEARLDNVPTWNYAVVHGHGTVHLIEDEARALKIMQQLVQIHDPEWNVPLDDGPRRAKMREIVVFEIAISSWEAKFKLSQNRSEADVARVANELSKSHDQAQRETGQLMARLALAKTKPQPPRP